MNNQLKRELKLFVPGLILMTMFWYGIAQWLQTETVFVVEAETPKVVNEQGGYSEIVNKSSTNVSTKTPEPKVEYKPENEVEKYIVKIFGDDAERGIRMLKTCENRSLATNAINYNSNGTWDFGLWQINEVHGYTIEQLSDHKFNTRVAYKIFKMGGNSFYYWTCGYVAGDDTYAANVR